ncbi:MAG: phosphotransferase [Actinomycetota bacterium]|nr:phosphotransferase [Actinomycetota bacterium]
MISPPPFPKTIDDLDSSFLSSGLQKDISGFESRRIGEERGMLGEIYELELFFADKAKPPQSIVAKFSALREEPLRIAKRSGSHERELRCYDELLSTTPVNVPEFLAAWYDPETAEFLLLQELVEPDASVDQIAGISLPQARLVIKEMAKLHAFWWGNPVLETLSWLPRLDSSGRRTNLTTLTRRGWDTLRGLLDREIAESIGSNAEHLAGEVDKMLCRTAEYPSTLVHSDLRADNLLFSLDGLSVALIDWQGCSIAPPAFDFAYFLVQSLTTSDRQLHEEGLLYFYLQELNGNGLAISADDLLEVYQSSLFYNLSIACAIPLINDISKPRVRELGVVMGSRSIHALRDHGQI